MRYGTWNVCSRPHPNGRCVKCIDPEEREACRGMYRAYKNQTTPYEKAMGRLDFMEECSQGCVDEGHLDAVVYELYRIGDLEEFLEVADRLAQLRPTMVRVSD